jgi:hypothetical protein
LFGENLNESLFFVVEIVNAASVLKYAQGSIAYVCHSFLPLCLILPRAPGQAAFTFRALQMAALMTPKLRWCSLCCMGRDTRTGAVLEDMVLPALKRGGYAYQTQVKIGRRPGGGAHKVDAIAEKNGNRILVSLKWQQVSGTAEQKVPFEVICLAEEVRQGKFQKAYLVLGGDGWTLRDFYTSGDLEKHLTNADRVRVVTLERFVALANKSEI